MPNVASDRNTNPIGVATTTNVIVAEASLHIRSAHQHKVLLIGEFSADGEGTRVYVVGDIQIDGNTFLNTQVNNLHDTFGTIVSVAGIVDVPSGPHKFHLRCYSNAANLVVHHRALSLVDLG